MGACCKDPWLAATIYHYITIRIGILPRSNLEQRPVIGAGPLLLVVVVVGGVVVVMIFGLERPRSLGMGLLGLSASGFRSEALLSHLHPPP